MNGGLAVERMRNGNPLPRQSWSLLLSQDFTYDTNVVTQADEALIQVSNSDALISKTGFLAKYQFSWLKTFSFIPELGSNITYHSRRSTPSVYQNDNASISPSLTPRNFFAAPASALLRGQGQRRAESRPPIARAER